MAGMIPVGNPEVAADLTTAALIDNPQTESQKSVDRRVRGVAVDIISSDPTIKESAAAAAEQAANNLNSVRAYPETAVDSTAQDRLPMQWVERSLRDPYSDTYRDAYEGTWSGTGRRAGNLPVLTRDGFLDPGQVPPSFPDVVAVKQMIQAEIDRIPAHQGAGERNFSAVFPILAARLAEARVLGLPLALVVVGSSTSAASPGYVVPMLGQLQVAFHVAGEQSTPQFNTAANFTEVTTAGIHGYSAAQGNTTSATYLDAGERERIAALNPALIHHMIGANDFRDQVSIAAFTANLTTVLEHFDTILTRPCQHVFWHVHERDAPVKTIPWASYGEALASIADARDDTICVDINDAYVKNQWPGADPLGLMSSDKVHQSPVGYAFMADLISQQYLA